MFTWNIYHGSREYARGCGDPLLGTVEARSKEEAEEKAIKRGMGTIAGVWACQTLLLPGERIDFDKAACGDLTRAALKKEGE